jgi:hypothetical protein
VTDEFVTETLDVLASASVAEWRRFILFFRRHFYLSSSMAAPK